MPEYKPENCDCCGQQTTYAIGLCLGAVDILKAIQVAIAKKGINCIHPRKEMEISGKNLSYRDMVREGQMTSNMVGNLSKCRFHGLIARFKGNAGSYLLTHKGAQFLRGEAVPKWAIVRKSKGKVKCQNIGYWNAEEEMVTVKDFAHKEEYWEGMNFTIREGVIIKDVAEMPKSEMKFKVFNPNQAALEFSR